VTDEPVTDELPTCPVCGGALEVTPSGALTCRIYGRTHYKRVTF
jgi:hypothetical protein